MPTLSRRDWIACCSALAGTLAVPHEARAIAALGPLAPPSPEPTTLRLCFNENPHGPPPAAVRAASAALARANRYADQEEFDALAALIAEREGVTPAHVLLGIGSSELLGLAAVAFLHEGGELVTAEPAFPHLANLAERIGARIRRVPLDLSGVHDLDAMAGAVGTDARLVNVCNPNNPTGTIVAGDRLRAFCEQVSSRAPVLVDEAYHELVDAPEHATMVPLARDGAPVLVMRTFSKVYGMAGYRVGYAIAPPAVIERLRAHQTTDLGPAALAAAIAAYQDRAFVERSRRLVREARELTARGLDALGIRHIPSHTSFVWFESGPARRDLPVRLHARGVRISSDVKPLTGDWARVSIGTAGEMRRFLRELRAVWG
ncbi:MAG: pyridoxal phosphate-dependent aminotransferase [Gemmatimonadales bacterium]